MERELCFNKIVVREIMTNEKFLKQPGDDFYGFNAGGKWKLSFLLMVATAAVLSFVLYVVAR